MSEQWEGDIDDPEESDLFVNTSDNEEDEVQAGLSNPVFDPSLVDPALLALGAQNANTTQGPVVASHQQWQNPPNNVASENSAPYAGSSQQFQYPQNAPTAWNPSAVLNHSQWQSPLNNTSGSGNPGPPLDQLAMDAIMTESPNSDYSEYSNHNIPQMGHGSSSHHALMGNQANTQLGANPGYQTMGGYGTNIQYGGNPLPLPSMHNSPNLPYGVTPAPPQGPRPTVDERGNVTGLPTAGGPNAVHSLQSHTAAIPERAPTQCRYGLPGLDYLPKGYTWSDVRCNNCASESKGCSSFPKFGRGAGQKDLSKILISFPCELCAADSQKAATCTWSIQKTISGSDGKLYWNGAEVIPDPVARSFSNKYYQYKYYKVIDKLETPPWPKHTGPSNRPGAYQTKSMRESIRDNAPAVQPARPKDQSGKIGKLAPKVTTKVKQPYRTKKRRACELCRQIGGKVAEDCDIATRQPCSHCEYHPDADETNCREATTIIDRNDQDSDSDRLTVYSDSRFEEEEMQLREELNLRRKRKRSGRIISSLTSGKSARSERAEARSRNSSSNTSSTPNRRKKATGKGKSGSGGIQRPPSIYAKSPSRPRGGENNMLGLGSSLDDFDLRETEEQAYQDDLFKPISPVGPCVGCKNSGKLCDQQQPCGNCTLEFKTCILLNQQEFPGQENPPPWSPRDFSPTPNARAREGRVGQYAAPRNANQRLYDMLPSTGLGIALSDEPMEPGEDADFAGVDMWIDQLPDRTVYRPEPEQGGGAEPFQQGSLHDPFEANPYQALQNDLSHGSAASEAQPFQDVRNHNEAQQNYEAGMEPEERAANALVQNHHIEGGSPLDVIESINQPQGIVMRNVDDQMLAEGRDLTLPPRPGPVLPDVGVPAHRAYAGPENCEDLDGCHEVDGFKILEGIVQMCGNHPTKPCCVFGHDKYCVCTECRETQDRFANGSSPDNPGQQEVIDGTKLSYCGACAKMTLAELQQGNSDVRVNNCLCIGQMTKAWMCGVHRQQAKTMVKRRTLLMRDWVTRKYSGGLFGNYLPCAKCTANIPDVNSGVWECISCCERVVKWGV